MAFLSKVGNILKQTSGRGNQINAELSASKSYLFQAVRCMSGSKLFVGGLSFGTDQQSLEEAFAKYGQVTEARVIMDRETGRSRGFGFVSFTSNEEASSAIQAMDGNDFQGRTIRVNYATERARPTGGFGGYGGGGYGGGGYGGGDGSYVSSNSYGRGGGNYGSGGDNFGSAGGDNFGSAGGDNFGSAGGDNFGSAGGDNFGSAGGYDQNDPQEGRL